MINKTAMDQMNAERADEVLADLERKSVSLLDGWKLENLQWGRGRTFGCAGSVMCFRGRWGVVQRESGQWHIITPHMWELEREFDSQIEAMRYVERVGTI